MPTLVMDLTLEQGAGRETQVQPPKGVWARFFDLDFDNPGELNLRDPTGTLHVRAVVFHDHNWTIEIPEAVLPRPAILFVERLPNGEFSYDLHRPGSPQFDHLNWMLDNFENPHRSHGRRWLIV